MSTDSDLSGIEFPSDEQFIVDVPALGNHELRPRTGRLISIALLALLLIVAVILMSPSLRKVFLPQLAPTARTEQADPASAAQGTLEAVPVLWERLNLGALPEEAARDLRQGKYYYDQRLPGNFGLAIDYWKKSLARLEEPNRAGVQSLVASAERELARQFSADSGDAFVLLKQGERDQAVALLDKMRADYLDTNAPQYVWASRMLYKRRR